MRGHVGPLRMVVRFPEGVSSHPLLLAVLTHFTLLDIFHSVSIIATLFPLLSESCR